MPTVITEQSIGINGAVFADRRAAVRRRVLKGGVVSFNKGYSTFECVIRNQSDDGAQLAFGETFALPNRFTISISDEAARNAEVRWRTQSTIGIAYV